MGKGTVGIAMDFSPHSKAALRWAVDNLINAGDHRVILINVQPPKADHTRKKLFKDTGSPLIPLEEFREINFSKQYGLTWDPEVVDILDTVSRTKGRQMDELVTNQPDASKNEIFNQVIAEVIGPKADVSTLTYGLGIT
ncbi:hypothetical protein LWI29_028297 [Acer saccharum]|uniref:UspA domain-containing protein n=1 Tax=Acer saccharum TaxID=4024 RepID=A0AA39SXF8_ACESA|nr:hypothetical protein LWI29_028297 [Acer saccharum]